jgi:hypothetical protein
MTNRTRSENGRMVVALTKDRQMDTGGVMGFCTWETLSSQLLTPN